jgi:microcystin-dependent protein
MSEAYVGEIRMFAGNFAPRGWAFCDGQLLAVSQNDALFSLIGTIYGGDGRSTFGLPDLRGRVPLHEGTGPGLTPRPIGQKSGVETVAITASQIAAHTHQLMASTDGASDSSPTDNVTATSGSSNIYGSNTSVAMDPSAIATAGSNAQAHSNLMPTQCVNFIVALVGIYPSRQ